MYKKICQIGALTMIIGVTGGLWGIEQYLDFAPGVSPSPLTQKTSLASSALGKSTTGSDAQIHGEEYYIKNSTQIDADLATMQAKMIEIWKEKYPLAASSCHLTQIQESFDGNEKISRTICHPNRIAGVVANRFLNRLFDYPDDREVMEEVIAMKWALLSSDNTLDPEIEAFRAELQDYQMYLDDFTTTQYANLQKREASTSMDNSLLKGKFLGLEIAFLFAEQEKLIVDYIL